MESIISCSPHPISWTRNGLVTKRSGPFSRANPYPHAVAVNGVYPCQDGYVVIILRNADDAVLSASITGVDELADPELGCIGFGKVVQGDRFNELLLAGFKKLTKEEIFHSAQELRMFWTSVKNIDEVFNWPQYRERGFWVDIDHPQAGAFTYPRVPFIMSQTPARVGRAPLLGEHNQEVYGKYLGYSREDLARLRELDVI